MMDVLGLPVQYPGPLNVSATIAAGTTYPDITIKAPLGPEFQGIPEWTWEAAVDLSTFENTSHSIFGPRYGFIYSVALSADDKTKAERYCGL